MEEILKNIFSAKIIFSLIVIAVIVVLCIVLRRIKENYKNRNRESKGQRTTAMHVVFGAVKFFLIFIGIILILQINGINVTGMVAGLGIASAIVGLALQDFLKDIIMGINIISDHFFIVGECVEYQGREGMILGFTLRTTKIGDIDDHSVITVCNRNITEIRRLSARLHIDVPLSYDEDVKKVAEVLNIVARQISALEFVEECKFLGTQSFESSNILYRLRIKCEQKKRADIRRAALGIIQNRLEEYGIKIPFAQLDVHCISE